MLFMYTSESTTLSENVPLFLNYDNYEDTILSWKIIIYWVVTATSLADSY